MYTLYISICIVYTQISNSVYYYINDEGWNHIVLMAVVKRQFIYVNIACDGRVRDASVSGGYPTTSIYVNKCPEMFARK